MARDFLVKRSAKAWRSLPSEGPNDGFYRRSETVSRLLPSHEPVLTQREESVDDAEVKHDGGEEEGEEKEGGPREKKE